jgi:hypothetical protein
MWTCPQCGAEVDNSFEVCWSCGTPAAEYVPPCVEYPPLKRRNELIEIEKSYQLDRQVDVEASEPATHAGRFGFLGCAGLTVGVGTLVAVLCMLEGQGIGVVLSVLGFSTLLALFAGGFGILFCSSLATVVNAVTNRPKGSPKLKELAEMDPDEMSPRNPDIPQQDTAQVNELFDPMRPPSLAPAEPDRNIQPKGKQP